MAVKTYRVGAGVDGNFGALFEADQAAASRTDGWTVGKIAAAFMADFDAGTKQTTGVLDNAILRPVSLVTGATANAFKTPAALTGTFAATVWTMTFAVRAGVASSQTGRMRLRVYKSVNADGSAATQLTPAIQVGTTSAALSTSADGTTTVSWTPAAPITLNNEYLFFAIAWEIVAASGSNTGDVLIRTGQAAAGTRFVTSDLSIVVSTAVTGLGSAQAFGVPTPVLLFSFPALGIRDDFNRADQSPAGGLWKGNTRTGVDAWQVKNNQLASGTTGFQDEMYFDDPGGPKVDQEAYLTFRQLAVDAYETQIRVRWDRVALNDYEIQIQSNTGQLGCSVWKRVGDVRTQLGSSFFISTPLSGDRIGIRAVGTTIIAATSLQGGPWIVRVQVTDASVTGPGFVGLYGRNGWVYDDFGGGNIGFISVTGLASAQSFGAVSVPIPPTTRSVAGLASAQAFGTLTFKVTAPSGGVSSAQTFGVPTILRGAVSRTMVGLASAQSFGLPKANVTVVVAGRTSAQALGVLTFKVSAPTGGVPSAQNFGVPTVRAVITWQVVGLASAQAFGVPTIKTAVSVSVVGLASAQAFGTITPSSAAANATVSVNGLASAGTFGTPTIKATRTLVVGSVNSAGAFGAATVKATFLRTAGGVSSAALFGVPTLNVKLVSGGVSSAGAFGVPRTRITVAVAGVQGAISDPTIVGRFLVGQRLAGGVNSFGVPHVSASVVVPGVLGSSDPTIVGRFLVGQRLVGGVNYFGVPVPHANVSVAVLGVASAQAFGLTKVAGVTVPVPGVSSSAQVGVVTVSGPITKPVVGLASAGVFGTVTIGLTKSVVGLASAGAFGTVTTRITRSAGGVTSAAAFGVPKTSYIMHLVGLGSAQGFGAIIVRTGPVTIPLLGIASAGNLGRVSAFVVYMRPPSCVDLPLVGSGTDTITLAPSVAAELALQPAGATTLTLQPSDDDSVDLDPARCN